MKELLIAFSDGVRRAKGQQPPRRLDCQSPLRAADIRMAAFPPTACVRREKASGTAPEETGEAAPKKPTEAVPEETGEAAPKKPTETVPEETGEAAPKKSNGAHPGRQAKPRRESKQDRTMTVRSCGESRFRLWKTVRRPTDAKGAHAYRAGSEWRGRDPAPPRSCRPDRSERGHCSRRLFWPWGRPSAAESG